MERLFKRTWAEISVDNLQNNYKIIKDKLKPQTKMMAIVKADAYGHGVNFVAPIFDKLGADWFGVSNIEEALQLREIGIKKPILILGITPPEYAYLLPKHDISQTIFGSEYAKRLCEQAKKGNFKIKAHLKIDTGMNRLGFLHHDFGDNNSIQEIAHSLCDSHIIPEGIFTHFAVSDLDGDQNGDFTKHQFELFLDCVNKLKEIGIEPQIKHTCNSGATLNNIEMHLDLVRPGIILYGLNPSPYFNDKTNLKPAMQLKSIVSMVKSVKKGETVSYGRTFTAKTNMQVATVSVGYADGYPRLLSNNGYVLINNQKAPVIGRVCMDQIIVDVTSIENVKLSDEVILFGTKDLSIDTYSKMCNTINYETVCLVGKRVPRYYYQNNKYIGKLDYIYEF